MAFIYWRRSNQIASMEASQDREPLILFHTSVSNNLLPCAAAAAAAETENHHLLTLPFLRNLLSALLLCHRDFLPLLPPARFLDRLLLLASLDVLSSASSSLDSLRGPLRLARSAASALLSQPPQRRRSGHALSRLLPALDSPTTTCHAVSLRQLQTMAGVLQTPRGSAVAEMAAYAMGWVLMLTAWCLLAAFSGFRERRNAVLPPPPKHLPWAEPAAALVDRVGEEWKQQRRQESSSAPATMMLGEVQRMVTLARLMADEGAEEAEMVEAAKALSALCEEVEDEVGKLQVVLREVSHTIARTTAAAVCGGA